MSYPQPLAAEMELGSYSPVELRRPSGSISDAISLEAALDDKVVGMAVWEAVRILLSPSPTGSVPCFQWETSQWRLWAFSEV